MQVAAKSYMALNYCLMLKATWQLLLYAKDYMAVNYTS